MISVGTLRSKIEEHFNGLIVQIEVRTQQLLAKQPASQHNEIIRSRNEFINEIKLAQHQNIANLNSVELKDRGELIDDWDDEKRRKIFKVFGFIVDLGESSFGYLVLINEYLSNASLSCLKEFLLVSKFDKLSQLNCFFKLENNVLNDNEPRINIKKSHVFTGERLIVRSQTASSLFQISELVLMNTFIKSVRSEASYLFKSIKRVEFIYSGHINLNEIIASIRRFASFDLEVESLCVSIYANNIRIIDTDVFATIGSLTELRLNFNKLLVFNSSRLMPKLQVLHLECNNITLLDSMSFRGVPNLVELNLSDNKLTSLDQSCISLLVNLTVLVLNENQLVSLEPNVFSCLVALEELRLADNQIGRVDTMAFGGLERLRVLDLTRNQITTIDNTFDDLCQLEKLYLAENKLKYVDVSVFKSLTSLKEMDLRGNSLSNREQLRRQLLDGFIKSLQEFNI